MTWKRDARASLGVRAFDLIWDPKPSDHMFRVGQVDRFDIDVDSCLASHRHGYSDSASLDPTFLPTTMEQAPLLYCRGCHTNKTIDKSKLRERDDNYGRNGDPTSQCSPCAAKKQQRSRIETKNENENENIMRTPLRTQQSPVPPYLSNNSRHCSTNKPIGTISVVGHVFPHRD